MEAINSKKLGWKASLYPELYDGKTMSEVCGRHDFCRHRRRNVQRTRMHLRVPFPPMAWSPLAQWPMPT